MTTLTVRLYGDLKQFGREYQLEARNPAEAISGLCRMIPALRQRLSRKGTHGYHVRVGKEFKGDEGVGDPCSSREIVRLIPATAGSSATLRIVVGVVLMAIGAYINAGSGGTGTFAGNTLMGMGFSLLIGGISELLAPKLKKSDNTDSNVAQSYTFSGPMNTAGQGTPVAVGFGTLLVGSHVISAQIYTEDMAMTGIGDAAPGDMPGTDDGVSQLIGTAPGNWAE